MMLRGDIMQNSWYVAFWINYEPQPSYNTTQSCKLGKNNAVCMHFERLHDNIKNEAY